MRTLVLALICLFVGAALALVGMSALHRGTSYPDGLMTVIAAQKKAMSQSLKENRCRPSDLEARLQLLRLLGNELEPAFQPTEDDALFGKHATAFRAANDAALADLPKDCISAKLALDRIGAVCQDCHRDFQN